MRICTLRCAHFPRQKASPSLSATLASSDPSGKGLFTCVVARIPSLVPRRLFHDGRHIGLPSVTSSVTSHSEESEQELTSYWPLSTLDCVLEIKKVLFWRSRKFCFGVDFKFCFWIVWWWQDSLLDLLLLLNQSAIFSSLTNNQQYFPVYFDQQSAIFSSV